MPQTRPCCCKSPSPESSFPLFLGISRRNVWSLGSMTCLPLPLPSDHATTHQRQSAAYTGAHSYQQDFIPLPCCTAGHCAPEKPRWRPGRGGAPREALHGGPGRCGACSPGTAPLRCTHFQMSLLSFTLGSAILSLNGTLPVLV